MQKGKDNFCWMPTFISFLIFAAFLGEPSKASDCVKVKCTIAQLGFIRRANSTVGGGEGQGGGKGPEKGGAWLWQTPNWKQETWARLGYSTSHFPLVFTHWKRRFNAWSAHLRVRME